MNTIIRLCKKVSDPTGETKGAWKGVACVACGVALRATVKATNMAKKRALKLHPICFDCGLLGPEYVLSKVASCGKVSCERKG
jgi:hypothetical protein